MHPWAVAARTLQSWSLLCMTGSHSGTVFMQHMLHATQSPEDSRGADLHADGGSQPGHGKPRTLHTGNCRLGRDVGAACPAAPPTAELLPGRSHTQRMFCGTGAGYWRLPMLASGAGTHRQDKVLLFELTADPTHPEMSWGWPGKDENVLGCLQASCSSQMLRASFQSDRLFRVLSLTALMRFDAVPSWTLLDAASFPLKAAKAHHAIVARLLYQVLILSISNSKPKSAESKHATKASSFTCWLWAECAPLPWPYSWL